MAGLIASLPHVVLQEQPAACLYRSSLRDKNKKRLSQHGNHHICSVLVVEAAAVVERHFERV